MQRERLPYLLIPVTALLAVVPLLLHGCSCGHDFDFHILSWMEAARQFSQGNLHPHWAYSPAYNAGEPRFVFYPPISWTIGALLGLLLPWTWAPVVYTWLALTVSGLALNRLAREFATPTAALLAATFYTVNPYMLFTAYERTAYAELLAAAWIPLLLHAILRERVTIPRIALPVALLWLTNAPAAVMSCYALAFITILRLISPASPSSSKALLALKTAAGTVLGLSLAAFYIVPAAYERRFVQIAMAIIPEMRIQDNFLFHHTSDPLHDQVLHTASVIAITLLVATALAVVIAAATALRTPSRVQVNSRYRLIGCLSLLSIAIALLLTPITAPIWNHAPDMAFLQFPWRLLAILAAILSLLIALSLGSLKLKPLLIVALGACLTSAMIYPTYKAFHQDCDEEDNVQARLALFQSNQGSEPTDEYTPSNVDNDSLSQTNPPYWIALDPDAKAPANITPGPAPTHLLLNLTSPQSLILNLRDYPNWRIQLNQTLITARNQRADGLIAIPIPAGPSSLSITYARTLDETLGNIITLISITILAITVRRKSPVSSS
jgi:hypothetical protein